MNYIALIFSIFLSVIGQYLLKKGVGQSNLTLTPSALFTTLFSFNVFTGLFVYGLSAIVWLFVLKKMQLSVAYPSMALSYILVVIIGNYWLNEPITVSKVVGIMVIIVGVIVVNN